MYFGVIVLHRPCGCCVYMDFKGKQRLRQFGNLQLSPAPCNYEFIIYYAIM